MCRLLVERERAHIVFQLLTYIIAIAAVSIITYDFLTNNHDQPSGEQLARRSTIKLSVVLPL